MKTYEKRYAPYFAGALVCVLISTAFAVMLQFLKGRVLDTAIAGEGGTALRSALALAAFILGETLFFYLYRRLGDRFAAGCVMDLKQDVFASAIRRDYAGFQRRPQGEYLAKYANEADAIRSRRFCLLPLLWEILFKIILVSGALFLLDWRVALVTLALLRETDVLILDEPLANLDDETAGWVEDLLLSITDRTLLVVSHQFTPEKLNRFDRVISLGNQERADAFAKMIWT